MSRDRTRGIVAALIVVALAGTVVPAFASTPVKIVGGPDDEYWPTSNGTYVVWTNQRQDFVWVKKLPNGTPRRVNPKGTFGEQATFVGSSNVLVYDQWREGGIGDVYFYDVATKTRTRAPAAVNKPRTFEWAAMASDSYIAFMRSARSGKRLLLYDRGTGSISTLVDRAPYYRPTFVGSTYVIWTVCRKVCKIHYWSEATGERIQPTASGRDQTSATLDEATGELYFQRTAGWCKTGSTIRRGEVGTSASVIVATIPKGYVTGETMDVTVDPTSTHKDLYFQRWSCRHKQGDIFVLKGVDTP